MTTVALIAGAGTMQGCGCGEVSIVGDTGADGADAGDDAAPDGTVDSPADTSVDTIPDPGFDTIVTDPVDPPIDSIDWLDLSTIDTLDWVELSDPVDWIDAADWAEVELPDAVADVPTAVVVDDPIRITDDVYTGCMPVVEWTGSEWGVAWGGWGTPYVFRSLDADGAPIGPITVIHPYISGLYPAIEWADGTYGFAGIQDHEDVYAGILSEDGVMIHGTSYFPGGEDWPDIDRYEQYTGWVVTYNAYDGATGSPFVYAGHMDNLGRRTGEAQEVGETDGNYDSIIVGFGDRASVIWVAYGAIWERTFSWPYVSESPEPVMLSDSHGFLTDAHLEAVAYRDRIVLAWLGSGGVRTLAFDPEAGTLLNVESAGMTGIRDRRPGLAAVHENGYLGLCWETGNGPAGGGGPEYLGDGASFRLIDENGAPLGAPVAIVSGINNIGGCAVGWSGSEFLVAYWNCGNAGEDYGIWVRRVTPLI